MNLQFENTNLQITKDGYDSNWASLMSCENREFSYDIEHNGRKYAGVGVRGDDAIWIPFSKEIGLKIIPENDRYQTLNESLETVEYIRDRKSDVFPKIFNCSVEVDSKNTKFLLIEMQNVQQQRSSFSVPDYVPPKHREHIQKTIQLDPHVANRIIDSITSLKLCPEDEWYKSINLIDEKIVDFHRFKILPTRYKMPSNGKTVHELFDVYKKMVARYTEVKDHNGLWEGKRVAAEKGYGPTMYETMMMIAPVGFMSDRTGYSSAHTHPIWDKYMQRARVGDVKLTNVPEEFKISGTGSDWQSYIFKIQDNESTRQLKSNYDKFLMQAKNLSPALAQIDLKQELYLMSIVGDMFGRKYAEAGYFGSGEDF